MRLHVYNTLTNRVEPFTPLRPGHVNMFVCGPTVYDFSHLGHAKTYTQFDLVARYLRHIGLSVTYVQNITDIDDKIIDRARQSGRAPHVLAAAFEAAFREDMEALGISSVDTFARAHDFIPQIVDQVTRLIDRGHAYRLDDGWYFDLSTFAEYGKLSGRTSGMADDAVSRIDEHPGKRQPGDFVLWKFSKAGEPSWSTALGKGRPGWHIEDTAITESFFGPQYDLHGGAVDLIFPHHEAEIAQMECAAEVAPLARYWLHTGFLRVGGDKMAKSAANFTTIREAVGRNDFRTLRYAFLSTHYRSSMELTEETLFAARSARTRVEQFARSLGNDTAPDPRLDELRACFFERMDDDFDTPGALALLSRTSATSTGRGSRPAAARGSSSAR